MSWQFGIHITIISIVLVTLIIHLHRRSPIQRMLFNSTQHALSLILAEWFSNKCMSLLINKIDISVLYGNLISLLLFCVFFCFFNNRFYDLLMILLPQPYSIYQWYKKTVTVFLCETFWFLLCGTDARINQYIQCGSKRDYSTVFLFPLVATSVISSFSVRIRMEKERLYELFLITTEISRGLTGGNLKHIKQALKGFLAYKHM